MNLYAGFLNLPGVTEILIILFLIIFLFGPAVMAILVRMVRGAEYEEPPDTIVIPARKRRRKR